MRVKILGDAANPSTLRVVNAETGEMIEGVTSATMFMSAKEQPLLTVHFADFAVDVTNITDVDIRIEKPGRENTE